MSEPGEGRSEEQRKPAEIYDDLIGSYHDLVRRIKKAQRRTPLGAADEETSRITNTLDRERHEVHLKLMELGKIIGKGKDDILVDIIRTAGTLKEYGLPEFSLLRDDDLIDTGDWHNQYRFNVNPTQRRAGSGSYKRRVGSKYDESTNHWVMDDYQSVLLPSEVMIVFAIVPISNDGQYEKDPVDYEEREKRAISLARGVGGRVFDERDSGFHEAYAKILGVVIPKADLEKTIGLIRNNPDKYRLDERFYPDETKGRVQRLRQANKAIGEIVGEDGGVETLPYIHDKNSFKDKRIALVDDDGDVFKTFIPYVVEASEGKATFIPHRDQSIEELAQEIMASNADLVLLDFHLSMGIEGTDVVRKLKHLGFGGAVLGFSSDKRAETAFRDAGAIGAVNKDIGRPWCFNDISKKLLGLDA